jgi:hypothetical protein
MVKLVLMVLRIEELVGRLVIALYSGTLAANVNNQAGCLSVSSQRAVGGGPNTWLAKARS